MNETKNLHIIIFFFLGIMLFINAGKGEMQPWDEGLYAYRAVSITQSNNYIDQTNESLAGLYSSTPPPFTHWVINASTRILGETLLAIRLFAIICSICSLVLVFYICRYFISIKYSLLASVFLSTSLLWNSYSRQAMTDVPLITMFLLLLFIMIKFYSSGKNYQILIYSVLFALVFAIAILTKIVISLFPIIFVIIYFFTKQKLSKKIIIALSSIIGIALASPWYIYMGTVYGAEFYNALFLPHITTAVENNTRESGAFYYLNGLIVSCPLIIFSFLQQEKKIKLIDFFRIKSRSRFIYFCIMAWFCIIFLMLTLSTTKMPHYTNYILVPAIILAICNLDRAKNTFINSRRFYFWALFTFIAIYWSFSFDFRQDIKLLTKFRFSESIIIFLAILIVSIFAYKLTPKDKILKFGRRFFSEGIIILAVFLISRIFFLNLTTPTGMSFGAERTIKKVKGMGMDTLVYVFHNYANSDSLNPQLEWYIYKNYKSAQKPIIIKYPISKNEFELKRIIALDSLRNYPLIYNIPNISPQVKANSMEIFKTRELISGTGNYFLFTRKVRNRYNGVQL